MHTIRHSVRDTIGVHSEKGQHSPARWCLTQHIAPACTQAAGEGAKMGRSDVLLMSQQQRIDVPGADLIKQLNAQTASDTKTLANLWL